MKMRTEVVSKFPSPTSKEALALVKQALAVREPDNVPQYFRPDGASPQEVVDFLQGMDARDGQVAGLRWLSSMGTTVIPLEGVLVSFKSRGEEAPRSRVVLLTSDDAGKWRIDYDAFARTVNPSWTDLLEKQAALATVRVYVQKDIYYNGPFIDEKQWICYSISSPDTRETLMAYCKNGSPQAAAIAWMFAKEAKIIRATLEIRRVDDGKTNSHCAACQGFPACRWMPKLPAWLESYRMLPKRVLLFAAGQFFINLINTAQFLLLNLFLKDRGLGDPAIAALTSQRFVATLFLALPAGLWLRGRPLRMPLFVGSLLFPLTALASLETVRLGMMSAASGCFLAMGFAGLLLSIAGLPMIMRLAPPEQSSEALSLLFATWAAASICGGLLSSVIQGIGHLDIGSHHLVLDEYATLLVLTLAGFVAPFLYTRLPDPVPEEKSANHWLHVHRQDWPILTRALLPTLCIATGAGLSIQFLNLFFSHVHHLGPAAYSAYGSMSNVLVLIAGLIVPEVKRRLGWRGLVIGVQFAAIVLLVGMGLTELVAAAKWALPLAVVLFILRQPLMSMAGPAISELTMNYVGERNRELVSACSGAIWSGAWWLAARTFQILRANHLPYWQVFMTTAVLYMAGTLAYILIIRAVEHRETVDAIPASAPEPGQV